MANLKITQFSQLLSANIATNADWLPIVDVSDTSMSATGTNKKVLPEDLLKRARIEWLSDVNLTGLTSGQTLQWNGSTWVPATISSGLTVGTTSISSGTVGRVLFEGAGNVLQQDAALFWDNTNKRLGVGATPDASVRLDVRAQGSLSTDFVFRLRNSGNLSDLYHQRGDGYAIWRNNAGNRYMVWDGNTLLQLGVPGGQVLNLDANSAGVSIIHTTSDILILGPTSHKFIQYNNGNFQLEEAYGILQTSGRGGISIKNASVIPSTSTIDRFNLYSADIVAGNAAPHFRTEAGQIIRLYQETTAVGSSTFVAGSGTAVNDTSTFDGYTIAQVVKALRNHGLLA